MSLLPEPITLPAVWVGLDELPVQAANNLAAQVAAPGEIILSFGHVTPPLFSGTPEEQQAQARSLRFVQVQSLARFSVTPAKVEEMIGALTGILNAHRQATGAQG